VHKPLSLRVIIRHEMRPIVTDAPWSVCVSVKNRESYKKGTD